jgi:hypothetical protein
MDKKIFNNLIISLKKIYKEEEALLNYISYYKSLIGWIKEHLNFFSTEQLENNRLNVLMDLDPDRYVITNPELLLEKENKRIGERDFGTIDDLLMSISDTLWDLVTIRSGKDCPNCTYDELRYVVAKDKDTYELLLECETCGWTEHTNGDQWSEGLVNIIPARLDEIKSVLH